MPTGAEWEHVARSGLVLARDVPMGGTQANFEDKNMFPIVLYIGCDLVTMFDQAILRRSKVADNERGFFLKLLNGPDGIDAVLQNVDSFRETGKDIFRALCVDDGHAVLAPVGSYPPNGYGPMI